MSLESELRLRSQSKCELCASGGDLFVYRVPPKLFESVDTCIYICETCRSQIDQREPLAVHHWRALNDSMWSPVQAVQVVAWRMLTRLRDQAWSQDLLDILYLDDISLDWAKATLETDVDRVVHKDANGASLEAGDTVVLTKDLVVKGANFTAKRGTPVRKISLVADNPEQIEGRVNGQHIVILTQFVKKA